VRVRIAHFAYAQIMKKYAIFTWYTFLFARKLVSNVNKKILKENYNNPLTIISAAVIIIYNGSRYNASGYNVRGYNVKGYKILD
jgi:hypothetical protein